MLHICIRLHKNRRRTNIYIYASGDPLNKSDPLGLLETPYGRQSLAIIGPATNKYNCHSYAWHNGEGDPDDSISDQVPPDQRDAYLIHHILGGKWDNTVWDEISAPGVTLVDPHSPNKVGDVVVYFDNKNMPMHSAHVSLVDPGGSVMEVISKDGQFELKKHHPADPSITNKYGSKRLYFRDYR